jgi:hypothetical protein
VSLLGNELNGLGHGSLPHYALSYYWSFIVIVPTFGGCALGSGAWVVPSFVFSPEEGSEASPDRAWIRPLQPLSSEQLRDLGLEWSALSKASSLKDLQVRLAELQLLYAHAASFSRIRPDLDEVGADVLRHYLSRVARQIGHVTNEVRTLLPAAINSIRQSVAAEETVLDVFLDPLVQAQGRIEVEQGPELDLDLKDCTVEAEWLQALLGAVATLCWLSIPGVIDSITASED